MSPGFPGYHSGPVECVWNIEGKINEIIMIDVKQFYIGNDNDCEEASLEVRDGSNDTILGKFCGSADTKKLQSHSHQMYIKYTTNGGAGDERFKIEFSKGNNSCLCCLHSCFIANNSNLPVKKTESKSY